MKKSEYRLFVEREVCKALGMNQVVMHLKMRHVVIGYMYGAAGEPCLGTTWIIARRACELLAALDSCERAQQ